MSRAECVTLRAVCPYCEQPNSADCFSPVDYSLLIECAACTGLFVIWFRVKVEMQGPGAVVGERERVEQHRAELAEIRRKFNDGKPVEIALHVPPHSRSGDFPEAAASGPEIPPDPPAATTGDFPDVALPNPHTPTLIRVDGRDIPVIDETKLPRPAGLCRWEDGGQHCDKPVKAGGMCWTHYVKDLAARKERGERLPRGPVPGSRRKRKEKNAQPPADALYKDPDGPPTSQEIQAARDRTGGGQHKRPHPYRSFRPGGFRGLGGPPMRQRTKDEDD